MSRSIMRAAMRRLPGQPGTLMICVAIATGLGACTAPSTLHSSVKNRYIDEPAVREEAALPLPIAITSSGPMRGFGTGHMTSGMMLYGARSAPVANRAVDDYLNAMAARLIAVWPYARPSPSPRVMLIADPSYGAQAGADGLIRINLGLLMDAGTEDEVAFILAHELSHLLRRHTSNRESQMGGLLDANSTTLQVMSVGATLASSELGRSVLTTAANRSDVNTAVSAGAAASFMAREAMENIIDPAWSRTQEAEADLAGIDLMTGAGFDPRYASSAFQRLQAQQTEARSDLSKAMGRTQTVITERVTQGQFGTLLRDVTGGVVSAISGAVSDLRREGRERHPPLTDRDAWVSSYRDRIHADAPLRDDSPGELRRLRALPRMQAMVLAASKIAEAQQALVERRPADALRAALAARQATPDSSAAAYQVALAQYGLGQKVPARDGLRAVRWDTGMPLEGYILLAQLEQELGNPNQALETLDEGGRSVGNPDIVLPNRIELHLARHDNAAAQADNARCQASSQRSVRQLCQEVMPTERAGLRGSSSTALTGSNSRVLQPTEHGGGFNLPGLGRLRLPGL